MNTMNELHGEALIMDGMYDPYNDVRVDDPILAHDIALAYNVSFTDDWAERCMQEYEHEEEEYRIHLMRQMWDMGW